MFQLQEPYAARPIRCLELWQEGEWRLKVYGIAYRQRTIRPELVEIGKELARNRLAESATGKPHYGIDTMLANPQGPDLDAYLAWQLNEDS